MHRIFDRILLVGAILILSAVLAGCSFGIKSKINQQAAKLADEYILDGLQDRMSRLNEPGISYRVEFAEAWLRGGDPASLYPPAENWWVVGEVIENRVPVKTYSLWWDKSFNNQRVWGHACREYEIAESVTVHRVPCESSEIEEPPVDAISPE